MSPVVPTLLLLLLARAAAPEPPAPPPAAFEALAEADIHDFVVLADDRPILIRLRVLVGDQPGRAAWLGAVRAFHTALDRNHDGKLTPEEAAAAILAPIQISANGNVTARVAPDLDVSPKDGAVSVEELAEGLRPALGPFRLDAATGSGNRRGDALFDHLDRDKDGQLTASELAAAAGSLHRLDRDDDELISGAEVAGNAPPEPRAASAMTTRGVQPTEIPAVVERAPGESPLRLIRLLLRKYDVGSSTGSGRPDAKLTIEEFAIPSEAFQAADPKGVGTLDAGDLRRYLDKARPDVVLDVALAAAPTGSASIAARGADGGPVSDSVQVRSLGPVSLELALGSTRVEFRVDDGGGGVESARKLLLKQFEVADANQDGYVEPDEAAPNDNQATLLAQFYQAIDRDDDAKVDPREVEAFVQLQAIPARGRLELGAINQGRAIFGLLDRGGDGQLSAREVREASDRVTASDLDRDGRIQDREIPHRVQLILTRGGLDHLTTIRVAGPAAALPRVGTSALRVSTEGPAWFRKMDRNHDGDISRREFLGPRDTFDRLDRDHDGLIDPVEAGAATPPIKGPGG